MKRIDAVEVRGWAGICQKLGVKDKRTARRILVRHGVLAYDGRTPVLNVDVYRMMSMLRHSSTEQGVADPLKQ
ncbi:MAG: hypothetical protein SFH39_12170 [Candidatus Magnetobacterium sp. LHC-1]